MEYIVTAALGGAVAALLSKNAARRASVETDYLGAARIGLREPSLCAEDHVARLDAMVRRLDRAARRT